MRREYLFNHTELRATDVRTLIPFPSLPFRVCSSDIRLPE